MNNRDRWGFLATDIEVEPWPPAPEGGMQVGIPPSVHITHTKLGVQVICTRYRSQHRNRDCALAALKSAIDWQRLD